jgi:hypothetical protein
MSEIMKKVRGKIGSKIKNKIQKSTDNLATKEARMQGRVKTVPGPKSNGKVMTAGMNLLGKNTTTAKTSKKKPAKKQTFGAAFKAARGAGKKTFMFEGKKYNTMTKEDVAKKKKTTLARKKSMGKMKVGLRAASGGYMKKMMGGGKVKKMAYGGKVKRKKV